MNLIYGGGFFLPGISVLWEQVRAKSILGTTEDWAVLVAVCTELDS